MVYIYIYPIFHIFTIVFLIMCSVIYSAIFHSCYLMLHYTCAVPMEYRINHLSHSFRIRYCETFLILTHEISTRKCTALNKRASYVDQIRMIACLAIILNYSYFQPCFFFFVFQLIMSGFSLPFPPSLYFVSFSFKVCVCNTTVRGRVSQG